MKRNIFFLIASVLVIALVVALPFAFTSWNELMVKNQTVLVFYIIFKVIYGLILLGIVAFALLGKFARGQLLFTSVATLAAQLIPLFIRLGVYMGENAVWYEVILCIVSLIIYVVVMGLFVVSNKKQLQADVESESSTIPVVSEEISENRHKR